MRFLRAVFVIAFSLLLAAGLALYMIGCGLCAAGDLIITGELNGQHRY